MVCDLENQGGKLCTQKERMRRIYKDRMRFQRGLWERGVRIIFLIFFLITKFPSKNAKIYWIPA